MQINDLEILFSKSRLETYYRLFPNDKVRAIVYYQLNTQLAESLYPLLSNFEIVLRNAIHNSFSIHFKTKNWFEIITYPELNDQIKLAKSEFTVVFPLIEKDLRQRNSIAFKLNKIRKFRNRIFHYEPICIDLKLLELNHKLILEILEWVNSDIVEWTRQIDRFDELFIQAQKINDEN